MSLLRPLLMVATVAFACWFTAQHVPHHSDPDPFQTLYAHLNPERLVKEVAHEEHGDAHVEDSEDAGHDAHAEDSHGEAEDDHSAATTDAHGDDQGEDHTESPWLASLSLPAWLGFFDMDPDVEGVQLVMTNLQIFQLTAVILIFIAFSGVPRYLRTGQGGVVSKLFAGFAMWIRDEVVEPVMGSEMGRKMLPLFLCLFFFILFMNLLGLVPFGATATASIFVTAALAALTLMTMIVGGMVAQGPIAFWKNLVPHVPLVLWPLMFVVELVGLFVKPFALMIRLFANMSGGHMVVLSFMGLIFFFGNMAPTVGYAISPVAVGFAVFIMIIEVFVAMLQAYIFTMLSVLFIHASIHPEH